MTTWKDVAGIIAPYAPTIGQVLGGLAPFPGGGMVGEFVGGLIAKQFGVPPTPEAVDTAVRQEWNANPEAVAQKLAAAESECSAKWDAIARMAEAEIEGNTAQSQAINETIRTEIATGVSWWHWRHLIGYATLIWSLALLPPLAWHMWKADAAALTVVTSALTASTLIFGIMAALNGYIANDSTRLKETAITGQQRQSVVATVAAKVTGRR